MALAEEGELVCAETKFVGLEKLESRSIAFGILLNPVDEVDVLDRLSKSWVPGTMAREDLRKGQLAVLGNSWVDLGRDGKVRRVLSP